MEMPNLTKAKRKSERDKLTSFMKEASKGELQIRGQAGEKKQKKLITFPLNINR